MEVLKDYVLGDTIARYMQPGPGGPVGMMLFPAAMAGQIAEKSSAIDSLVQIKTVGGTAMGETVELELSAIADVSGTSKKRTVTPR